MGYTRKVLAKKEVSDTPVFYSSSLRLDLAESFHLHYRNVRLEFSPQEFQIVAGGMALGYLQWLSLGKPKVRPTHKFLKLFDSKVLPQIGLGCEGVRGAELSVELQQQTDYIHLHYRGLKLEFSVNEYLEFAQVVSKAKETLEQMPIMKDYPKRIGYDHKLQAEERVISATNSGRFWIGKTIMEGDCPKTRDSIVFNADSQAWERHVVNNDADFIKELPNPVYLLGGLVFIIFRPLIRLLLQVRKEKRNTSFKPYFRDMTKKIFIVFLGVNITNKFIYVVKTIIGYVKKIFKHQ